MREDYDVVIIGAGSAGLSAVKEVRKYTEKFLLIDRGPLGTTCSRVGCMPSKVFIQAAHDFATAQKILASGAAKGQVKPDFPEVMKKVRSLRDYFTKFAVDDTLALGEKFLQGEAKFIGPNILQVSTREISAKSIILATGSSPRLPKEWQALGKNVVTTDSFFELDDIKKTWAVIGLGPLGLELGSALQNFGCEVLGFHRSETFGGLHDKDVQDKARTIFGQEFQLHLQSDVQLEKSPDGRIRVIAPGGEYLVDQVLVAIGREPNVLGLDLHRSDILLGDNKIPLYNKNTLQAETETETKGSKVFVAGDMSSERPILHEASDEGRIAGVNANLSEPRAFQRRTLMYVTFSLPGLLTVGEKLSDIPSAVVGEVDFAAQGRSVIIGENQGILRIYADKVGKLRGAEMIGPSAEHLAFILAGAITQNLSASDLLRQPFYHPTVEEGLRTALRKIEKQLPAKKDVLSDLS